MKKFTRIITAVLALTMMTSLSACGNSAQPASTPRPEPANNTQTSNSGDSATNDAAAEAEPGIPGFTPFANRVRITVPVYDRSKEGYPAVDDNYWTKWVQTEFGDKYNIEVKYVAIPRTDVMTKYSLLIAGRDTPTIMMEYDYPKVAQWANDGAMQTIDLEALKKVAPTIYQSMVDNNQLGYSIINGENYFVLTERPYYFAEYQYADMVRMDWLREVGYDHVPKDYAEYKDAVNKIIEKGLAKNPIPLGVPSTANVDNWKFREHPVDEKEWAQNSSLTIASLPWKPTYEFLKRYNSEYNMGWYSPEFDLEKSAQGMGADQAQANFISGQTFSYGGYMGSTVDWLNAFYEKNPDAELAIKGVYNDVEPGVADSIKRSNNAFGMIVGFSSLATAEQLKAAWMLMEWMIQPETLFVLENGIEGVTYTMNPETGLPDVDGAYRGPEMLNHNMNIDMTCLVHAAKKTGTIEQTIAGIAPKGLPQDFTGMMMANFTDLESNFKAGKSYSDPVFATTIDSEAEYSATLLSLYQEYFVQLVKCKPEDFDALYADLSKKYLEAGYQEVIDERLEAYEDGNSTKLPDNLK